MPRIDLSFLPLRAALCEGRDNIVEVLVRAQAPAVPEAGHTRNALNLSLVIDRSGSMSGEPLQEAKRCASTIIDSLASTDRASIVVYDSEVDLLVPARPVGDRLAFRAALETVESGGATNLYGGWVKGAEQAAIGCTGGTLSRVLLLSDGNANAGRRSVSDIAPRCAEMAAADVSTSTYGLGRDFNEDLMAAMARDGQGNAYYGRTAEDLEDPFRQEFDLLAALCARGVRLTIRPATGVLAEIVNRYPTDSEGRSMLPDIAYGSEAWALVRMTVPRQLVDTGYDLRLLSATLEYGNLGAESEVSGPIHLRLPRLPTDAFAAVAPNDIVASRSSEVRAAAVLEEARQAARANNWSQVEELLAALCTEAKQSPWLAASIDQLQRYVRQREMQRFSKESLYKSVSMRGRLSAQDEGTGWSPVEEAERASFLRRKAEQGRRFQRDASDGEN